MKKSMLNSRRSALPEQQSEKEYFMQGVSQKLQAFLMKKVKIVGMVSLIVLAVLLLQVTIASAASTPQITNTIYYGCVNNTSGAITIVKKFTKCQTGFHKIHWNQRGPVGPAGPQGPAGPTGPQGPQGPSGVSQGYYSSNGQVTFAANQQLTAVATTNPVAAGTYLVTGTETAIIDTGDTIACIFGTVNTGEVGHIFGVVGPSALHTYTPITVNDTVSVNAGDQIVLYCVEYNNDPNTISYNAGISAIQLTSVQSSAAQHQNQKLPLPKLIKHSK
jgi:hypothetical protein